MAGYDPDEEIGLYEVCVILFIILWVAKCLENWDCSSSLYDLNTICLLRY